MSKTLDLAQFEPEELIAAVNDAGGQRAFARQHGLPRSTLQNRLKEAQEKLETFTDKPIPEPVELGLVPGRQRFILTSAQDHTSVHKGFLSALMTYRDWLRNDGSCELMIAGFTYNKRLFEDHSKWQAMWPDMIREHMVWGRVRIADKIDFCAEMNTRPTAKTPLTGFETYTRHRWGIFPHAKVQLRSIATMKHEPSKQIMTTGAVTLPNYVQLRAGIEAQFHHVLGAVLVEVDENGVFFCRHLLAEDDGSFYDLDHRITPTSVTAGHRVEAINHGDIHTAQIDPIVSAATWGVYPTSKKINGRRVWEGLDGPTMIDVLYPKYQFFHDVSDQRARNHHNLRDPHHMFELFHHGIDSVEDEQAEVAMFLALTRRPWCESIVVESNHDLALKRWLKEADYKIDPLNALFFLRCQTAIYQAIKDGNRDFSIFEHVMRTSGFDLTGIRFLRTDDSFRIFDIEKALHGHNGANGGRGSVLSFTRMGPKATVGHYHSPEIRDGIYAAGVKGLLDMGYNLGLSSWAHADVITLANGKRQIITWQDGRWRL